MMHLIIHPHSTHQNYRIFVGSNHRLVWMQIPSKASKQMLFHICTHICHYQSHFKCHVTSSVSNNPRRHHMLFLVASWEWSPALASPWRNPVSQKCSTNCKCNRRIPLLQVATPQLNPSSYLHIIALQFGKHTQLDWRRKKLYMCQQSLSSLTLWVEHLQWQSRGRCFSSDCFTLLLPVSMENHENFFKKWEKLRREFASDWWWWASF